MCVYVCVDVEIRPRENRHPHGCGGPSNGCAGSTNKEQTIPISPIPPSLDALNPGGGERVTTSRYISRSHGVGGRGPEETGALPAERHGPPPPRGTGPPERTRSPPPERTGYLREDRVTPRGQGPPQEDRVPQRTRSPQRGQGPPRDRVPQRTRSPLRGQATPERTGPPLRGHGPP